MIKQTGICIILMLLINSVYAEQPSQSSTLDNIANSAFVRDSQIQLSLRNYGKYLNDDEMAGNKMVHTAWGQAFAMRYTSGYFADFIGVDGSFVGVVKLGASKYFASRSLLWNDGPGFDKHNAKSFNKFDQRYIKIKLGDDQQLNYNAKLGWQVFDRYGVLRVSNQLSKNTYLGYSGTLGNHNYSLDTLYVTRYIDRDSPQKKQFLSENNKHIDHILSAGINYKTDQLTIAYAFGEADHYMQRHLLDISYKPIEQLTLGSQIYINHPLSIYNQMPSSLKAADGNAWYYAADVKWQQDDIGIKFGVAYTKANKDNGDLGYFKRNVVDNTRWRFDTMTEAAYHYQRDGELALTLLADYQYHPDFYSAIQINYGQFHYKQNHFKVGEINFINRWTPSDPRLKNLIVSTMIGKGLTYQNIDNKQPLFYSNGQFKRGSSISGEFIIEYQFNL